MCLAALSRCVCVVRSDSLIYQDPAKTGSNWGGGAEYGDPRAHGQSRRISRGLRGPPYESQNLRHRPVAMGLRRLCGFPLPCQNSATKVPNLGWVVVYETPRDRGRPRRIFRKSLDSACESQNPSHRHVAAGMRRWFGLLASCANPSNMRPNWRVSF